MQGMLTTFIAARNLHKGVADWRKLFAVAAGVVYTCAAPRWCQSLMHVKRQDISTTPKPPASLPLPSAYIYVHTYALATRRRVEGNTVIGMSTGPN